MSLGIRQVSRTTADQTVQSSIALVDATGLSIAIAANAIMHLRFIVGFTTGATGGARFQVAIPAAGSYFLQTVRLINTAAATIIASVTASNAVVANALANAANHLIEIDVDIVNGSTAGNVKLQWAQNTSDALTATLLKGSFVEAVTF